MRYDEAADFLLDLQRYRPRAGTDSTADLLDALDSPHEGPAYVQIAGSNGKGSTARMLESVLREAGLDVGLFTSPHFDDVRERVRVNGRKMPKSALAAFVEAAKPHIVERAAADDPATFFEAVTAMGLWHFGREDVDVAVLEVGIGGKYDATSVVDPAASAVTSVTLEHQSVLGDTVEEIARDKAHVAPAARPLVTAAIGDALDAIREQAGDTVVVGEDVTVSYGGRVGLAEAAVDIQGRDWSVSARLPHPGRHQAENAGVAAVLARQLADADSETIARGVRGAHWPGRFEVMDDSPLTVLDGAHNPGACDALADVLAEYDYDDLVLVLGAMNDKDHAGMADALPDPGTVVACEPATPRAEDPDVLARVFETRTEDVQVVEDVESAVETGLDAAHSDALVLVTGSLYAVAEARRRWTRTATPRVVRDTRDAGRALDAGDAPHGNPADHVAATRAVRLREERAARVETLMTAVGGACDVSALRSQPGNYLDVTLSGSRATFSALCERLDAAGDGLSAVADDLRASFENETPAYPWGDGTAVMGILNVTPDSFHDGGEYRAVADAVERAEELVDAGVDVIDVGGESTRPGAEPVSASEEIDRIVPVIERISDLDALVSVDTMKAEVGRAALEAGADILNDVTGLGDPEMRFVAAEYGAPLVVMHSLHAPVEPGESVTYDDVVDDVLDELRERVLLAEKAGLPREKIIVDPGIGFGKSVGENFEILDRTPEFRALGCPVLVGHSHKSMFDRVERYPDEGGYATVAATALAADRGADIVRVHDAAENVAAVRVADAVRRGSDDA
ncbi:dihydropteroate synthase [Salarchaeum sp. JOR-1]|uniref:dihydropteroate synthase n=1 Tax=Salarchaeum sp. JOR-1 TaxID=2599399 RepID=UPI001198837C|nr:dihydropteroate synthase [Salarchaeum sp. JOR-1]QDX39619.1 dihydropteroate synthase [Salarchaeum sp. JOR-1]